MIEQIKEYMGPIVTMASIFGAYVAGKERMRARISTLSKDIERLEETVHELSATIAIMQPHLATMANNIEWLKKNAERL